MDFTILYWCLVAIMMLGAVGEMIPGMPGASLVLFGIVVWAIATGFAGIGWSIVVVFALLVLSSAIEFLSIYWGAKKFGASKWGQIGAYVGLFLGFFGLLPALPFGGPIVGLLFGPFIGAFIGEFLFRGRSEKNTDSDLGNSEIDHSRVRTAFKASIGIVFGTVMGNLIDGTLAVVAVIVFIVTTYPLVSML